VEDFLQTENLNAFFSGRFDQGQVFLDHGLFDFGGGSVVFGIRGLDVGTFYNSGHKSSLKFDFVAINPN
jgi:hypothetical protein